ncbi:MAG: type II toxin-antitoxin system HigB family toxin [Okeania sp. SIO3I5]|uniref:type II toxin-antitoxin system HigB family toxin n=1 Tax=Okeania sp. SIO3I5 TaxID=2607805 RepID=UPI0013BC5959|nr:type II toxin-antitoxin system HigB family toxin [Okeania sp. SIO3I5]NEQ37660.1 type II toxin-antitoxin system HigB family toxin [Okeania sp. SIO3I5]
MRIISRRTLRVYWERHYNAKPGLLLWYNRVLDAEFQNFNDLRQTFPSEDLVGNFTVFKIVGNNYRLITYIRHLRKLKIKSILSFEIIYSFFQLRVKCSLFPLFQRCLLITNTK